jgi:hypothetical protein
LTAELTAAATAAAAVAVAQPLSIKPLHRPHTVALRPLTLSSSGSNAANQESYSTAAMEGWSKISQSIAQLNLGEKASGLAKGFGSTVQVAKSVLESHAPNSHTDTP